MSYQLEILTGQKTVENPEEYVVFVHGICHGAWCWEKFINFYSDYNCQCYAISLRGHAGSGGKEKLHTFRLSDYVDDVKNEIANVQKKIDSDPRLKGKKPFLVGHSMGGGVVQQYIGKYPDTVQGAVLLASATAPKMLPEEVGIKSTALFYSALIALGCGFLPQYMTYHSAFFSGRDERGRKAPRITKEEASRYAKLLQKESTQIVGGVLKNKGGDLVREFSRNYAVDIPVLVIGSSADAYFPRTSLEKTADMYVKNKNRDTALTVLDHLCHDMMLDPEWNKPAQYILEFMKSPTEYVNSDKNELWKKAN